MNWSEQKSAFIKNTNKSKSISVLLVLCALLQEHVSAHAEDLNLPDLPGKEQASYDGVLRGVATQLQQTAKREALQREQRDNPSAFLDAQTTQLIAQHKGAPLSNVSLPIGSANYSLGKDALSVSTPDSRLRLGTGSANGGVASRLEYAGLINERFAVGLGAQLGKYQSEILTRNIYVTEDKKLEIDVALSYMKGKPKFDFDSGAERLSASQIAGVASTRRLFAPEDGLGLHSVGASVWGSQARSPNNLASKTVIEDTAAYFKMLIDPRRISLGRMNGQSLDLQYATSPSMVLNGSLGTEQVVYPMGDGTRESHRRPYFAGGMKYELANNTVLDMRLASGVANSVTVGITGESTRLALNVMRGRDGAPNNTSLMLYVDVLKLLAPPKKHLHGHALALKESLHHHSHAALLDKASSRHLHLPHAILAKVDHTGVQKIQIDKAGLPDGSKVVADQRALLISVGSGALTLAHFKHNGAAQALMPQFGLSPATVTVAVADLPKSSAVDSYELHVVDALGATYEVKLSSTASR